MENEIIKLCEHPYDVSGFPIHLVIPIKKSTSQKIYDKVTGEWMHEQIVLQPLNHNYDPIKIEKEDGFMVIGEFIEVVK